MATSGTFQQPTFVQMPHQPSTSEITGHPYIDMMMSTAPVAHGHGVVRAPCTQSDPRQRNKSAIGGIGIVEIVMGGFSIILTIIPLAITQPAATPYQNQFHYTYDGYQYYEPYAFTGFSDSSPGIWGGIFVVITGILAVRIKSNPSRCMYIANMIVAIITACVTFSSTFISGLAAAFSSNSTALVALHIIISLLNFVSWTITIIHSAFCCRGVCCDNDSQSTHPVVYIPTQSNLVLPAQPQYVQSPYGQLRMHVIRAAGTSARISAK